MTGNPRLESRVLGENGRWFAVEAPAHVHGRSSGYVRWGCLCDACRGWHAQRLEERKQREAYNQAIIEQLLCPARPRSQAGAPVEIIPDPELVTPAAAPAEPPIVEVEPAPGPPPLRTEIQTSQPITDRPVPPITSSAQAFITSVDQFNEVSDAYYRPEWTAPLEEGRTRRAYGNTQIVVAADDGPILFVGTRERAQGNSELLTEQRRTGPKAKGGRGGSQNPTDQKDLVARLRAEGCTVEKTGSGHIRVVLPNEKVVVLPSTASDYRSLKNGWATVKRLMEAQ